LKPTNLGISSLRSIVRSRGVLKEETLFIPIIEHKANFEVKRIFDTKEIDEDDISYFNYSIKYTGGDLEDGKNFTINVTAPANFEIESTKVLYGKNCVFSGDKKERSISLNFKKEDMKIIEVTGYYSESKDKLSSPIITVEGDVKDFEPDISVSPGWIRFVKMHAELITIIILSVTLISSNFITIYLKVYDKNIKRRRITKLVFRIKIMLKRIFSK